MKLKKVQFLFWIGLALLFLGLFIKISWELHEDTKLVTIDNSILLLIGKFRRAAWNGSAIDITALGSPTVISLFTIVGTVFLWLKDDHRESVYLGMGSTGAALGTVVMKHLYSRARPNIIPRLIEVNSFSYPSGHSLGATSFYLLLMFLCWHYNHRLKIRIFFMICAFAFIFGVGFSRLYLGVHFPSDVFSGICLGAAWTLLLTAYFFRPKKAD